MIKRLLIILVALIVTAAGAVSAIYAMVANAIYESQPETAFYRAAADLFSIPVVVVADKKVPYTEYLRHHDALRVFLSGPTARAQGFPAEPTPELNKETLDRVVRIATVEAIAAEREFIVTPLDVDRAYDELVLRAGTSTTPGEVRAFLKDEFGWSEADFKRNVVRPALLEDGLRAKEARENGGDLKAFDRELEERIKSDVRIRIKL